MHYEKCVSDLSCFHNHIISVLQALKYTANDHQSQMIKGYIESYVGFFSIAAVKTLMHVAVLRLDRSLLIKKHLSIGSRFVTRLLKLSQSEFQSCRILDPL